MTEQFQAIEEKCNLIEGYFINLLPQLDDLEDSKDVKAFLSYLETMNEKWNELKNTTKEIEAFRKQMLLFLKSDCKRENGDI